MKRYWKHTKVLVTENSGSSNGAKEIQSKDNAKEENKSCKVQLGMYPNNNNNNNAIVLSDPDRQYCMGIIMLGFISIAYYPQYDYSYDRLQIGAER